MHGARAFPAALPAHVWSGFILLRRDLSRAADDLGMGLRTGGRPFVLKALLSQNLERVLAWLGREARGRTAEHTVWLEGLGPIREHWVGRAIDTADLLESLAEEADLRVPA